MRVWGPRSWGGALNRGRAPGVDVRAKDGRRGADSGRGRTRESPSRARRGEDGPDRWGPPIGGREKGKSEVAGLGQEELGRQLGCGKGKKKKGGKVGLGQKEGKGKEKVFCFVLFFLNKGIQTHSFKFKFGEFKFN